MARANRAAQAQARVPARGREMADWPADRRCMEVLAQLLLMPRSGDHTPETNLVQMGSWRGPCTAALSQDDLPELLELCQRNHVVVRALGIFLEEMADAMDYLWAEWALEAIENEHRRAGEALEALDRVVRVLRDSGCPVIVIKSLDHWPDLGSDLDLFTTAAPQAVLDVMTRRLRAQIQPRSWGDRLACKWNFSLPGLPEMVEIHVGRLGQTGEHVALGHDMMARAVRLSVGEYEFPVPAAEDRIVLATLQRMYRHFYLRLCDVMNTLLLLSSERVPFDVLRRTAQSAGVWEGVATYLTMVDNYAQSYSGRSCKLPQFVRSAAQGSAHSLRFERGYLRVPMLAVGGPLYAREMVALTRQKRVGPVLRLSAMPGLATAAAISFRLTGSDKGIW